MDRSYKLGDDLHETDNILDAITFDEILMTINCNVQNINRKTVLKEIDEILEIRLQDYRDLLAINIDEIVKRAKQRRFNT